MKEAWLLPLGMVIKSVKECCTSSVIDWTEDDAIFEESADDELGIDDIHPDVTMEDSNF